MAVSPLLPRPDLDLQAVQRKRKLVLMLGAAAWVGLVLVTRSRWSLAAPAVQAIVEEAGLFLILVCILGRTWCTLYIGGQKKKALVTAGPYSVVRNPLYVFTSIGAAGIGAQTGSILLALALAVGSLATFAVVARQEESFLATAFPEEFAAYAGRVPRFWPRLAEWREADELLVKPHLVRRTFLEACLFLLAVPAAGAFAWLQQAAELPVLLTLP